jgi:3-hydroxyisobutyrate dehydrogenase
MKTVILGGGIVGLCYAKALADQGHALIAFCDSRASLHLMDFAASHALPVHAAAGPWLADADLVVSAVFGTVALELAEQALAHMSAGALYVDMTTADPQDMSRAETLARSGGQRFVDVAITGAVNLSGARTPLLCSGEGAEEVRALLAACGAPIRVVGTKPGDAASLKLLRSIFTKGMEALAVECLVTAERKGLRAALHDVLSDIDEGSLRELMESMVRTHIPHSARRRNEVVEAQRQMQMAGVAPLVMPAVQDLFERTADGFAAHGYEGGDTATALAWLGQLSAPSGQVLTTAPN